MEHLALIIMIVGAAFYLILTWAGKGASVAELGRIAFFAGLLAWLIGK